MLYSFNMEARSEKKGLKMLSDHYNRVALFVVRPTTLIVLLILNYYAYENTPTYYAQYYY